MIKTLYLITFVILTSCGTTMHLKLLYNTGIFREEKSTEAGYDYKVFIRNSNDFGWNGDVRGDREKAVKLIFEERCKSLKVIDEHPLQTGTYPINRPAITWIMQIKCGEQ